jgi:exosortase E/protease (VPEID-CTERM system)
LDAAAPQLPSDANELHEISGSRSFGPRLILAALALTVESVAVAAFHHPWLRTINVALGPIAFLVSLLFFGRHRLRLRTAGATIGPNRATSMLAAIHLLAVGAVFAIQFTLLRTDYVLHTQPVVYYVVRQQPSGLMIFGWYAFIVAMLLSLIAIACPFRTLFQIARNLGPAWIGATASTAFILAARSFGLAEWDAPNSWLGNTLAAASFQQVVGLLRLTTNIPLVTHSDTRILGTPTFLIHLAGRCSGIEGLALTLVLTVGYILLERRSLRLTRAIWLIPAALTLAWCSNILRLAILIVIGNAGHPAVALNGFHSEAGWIAFSAISIGFLLIADHSHYFQKRGVATIARTVAKPAARSFSSEAEITVAYLMPLLAIMATGLFTRAVSNGFETLYPLRFVFAAAVILFFRKDYRNIRWNIRAMDVVLGLAVGALWIALAPFLTHHANSGATIANGLARLKPAGHGAWLTFRVLAAITTVPFAEELAFRGFLARRLTSIDAGILPYGLMSIPAILLSSVAFAALHGSLWPLGLVAGIVFAFLARRRNGLGSSIVAHSMANLTLAVWVLSHHNFNLW